MAMENEPFEDVFPIENGGFSSQLCLITRVLPRQIAFQDDPRWMSISFLKTVLLLLCSKNMSPHPTATHPQVVDLAGPRFSSQKRSEPFPDENNTAGKKKMENMSDRWEQEY